MWVPCLLGSINIHPVAFISLWWNFSWNLLCNNQRHFLSALARFNVKRHAEQKYHQEIRASESLSYNKGWAHLLSVTSGRFLNMSITIVTVTRVQIPVPHSEVNSPLFSIQHHLLVDCRVCTWTKYHPLTHITHAATRDFILIRTCNEFIHNLILG